MPLADPSKLYAVSDAKIAKLTADVTTAPTYASVIDVPGIKNVGLSFDISNVELRGDNKQLDSDSTLVGVTLSFAHAKISYDALAVLLGGTVTHTGTTPNMVKKYRRIGTDAFSYFKFEAKTPTNGVDTVGGDGHIVVYKAKVTEYSLGLAEENYQEFSGSAKGVFTISNDLLWDLIENETASAIA